MASLNPSVCRSAFMRSMLRYSERAAHIARTIRAESSLFSLLVEEKTGDNNTKLCGADFKTLADVLIQCCVVAQIEHEYPCLAGRVYGEEEATFTNQNGETLTVQINVCSSTDSDALAHSIKATADLLSRVLDNNQEASLALATAVHECLDVSQLEAEIGDAHIPGTLDLDRVSFWLDPIDNTADYIHANESSSVTSGISCVTVLLGAFDRYSGLPLAGTVVQPFHHRDCDGVWCGRTLWGISDGDVRHSSPSLAVQEPRLESPQGSSWDIVVIGSRNEPASLVKSLQENASSSGCSISFCTGNGAGFKALCALTGQADAYLLSKPSTYQWDTCGVQAILQSLGGHMLAFSTALHAVQQDGQSLLEAHAVRYSADGLEGETSPKKWCNVHGLLAVRDLSVACKLLTHCCHK